MPRTRASGNPWRMLNVARLPAADFGAGVVMVGDSICMDIVILLRQYAVVFQGHCSLSCVKTSEAKSRISVALSAAAPLLSNL